MENGYWDEDGMTAGSARSKNRISTWANRIMRRRGYTRLSGRSKRMRMAKLGSRKGKGASFGWRLKSVPRLRVRIIRSAAKSWMTRIRDRYMNLMAGLGRSLTLTRNPSRKMDVKDFNAKVIVEIYKSLGIDVKPDSLPDLTRAISD